MSNKMTGSPMDLPTFFFLLPPKMAFLEAKHMEGNHGLT